MTEEQIKNLKYEIGSIIGFRHGQEISLLVDLFLKLLAEESNT